MEIVLGVAIVVALIWVATRGSTPKEGKPTRQATPTHVRRRSEPRAARLESQLRAEIEESVRRDYGHLTSPPELRRVQRGSRRTTSPLGRPEAQMRSGLHARSSLKW